MGAGKGFSAISLTQRPVLLFPEPKIMQGIKILKLFTNQAIRTRNLVTWDLMSAVSLERVPVVTRPLKTIEEQAVKVLTREENSRSYKSDFEINLAKEKNRKPSDSEDIDAATQFTAQDFLDASVEELKKFKFASREGVERDAKSTKRELDRRLLLIVKEKMGSDDLWILPQGLYNEGEPSLRATAERIVREKLGESLKVRFLGNAPSGFYKYKYPKSVRQASGKVGAKVFFFKAQLLDGKIDESKCSDFQWATRSELDLLPQQYRKSVGVFLIDEEN